MELLDDYLILNDNYHGLLVLDFDLNIVKKIPFTKELSIYAAYIYMNQVLLYCPEDSCFVFVNVLSSECKYISLTKHEEKIFLNLYQWCDDSVLIMTNQGDCICIDLSTYSIKEELNIIEKQCISTLTDWALKLKKDDTIKIFPKKRMLLVQNVNLELNLFYSDCVTSFKEFSIKSSLNLLDEIHDWDVCQNCVVAIAEKKIVVFFEEKVEKYYPSQNNSFLRGCLAETGRNLFILSGNNLDEKNTIIEKHQI